jgi:hypothetical protein
MKRPQVLILLHLTELVRKVKRKVKARGFRFQAG